MHRNEWDLCLNTFHCTMYTRHFHCVRVLVLGLELDRGRWRNVFIALSYQNGCRLQIRCVKALAISSARNKRRTSEKKNNNNKKQKRVQKTSYENYWWWMALAVCTELRFSFKSKWWRFAWSLSIQFNPLEENWNRSAVCESVCKPKWHFIRFKNIYLPLIENVPMIIAGRKITRHSSLSFFVCFVFGLAGVSYTQLLLNGIDEFHGLRRV